MKTTLGNTIMRKFGNDMIFYKKQEKQENFSLFYDVNITLNCGEDLIEEIISIIRIKNEIDPLSYKREITKEFELLKENTEGKNFLLNKDKYKLMLNTYYVNFELKKQKCNLKKNCTLETTDYDIYDSISDIPFFYYINDTYSYDIIKLIIMMTILQISFFIHVYQKKIRTK